MEAVQQMLRKYVPDKDLDWWVKLRAPKDILKNHATFLYCEILFYLWGFLTFIHAMRSGGRFRWLWLATIFHGLTVECVSYFLPDIDNFWHAQSMVMLLGQRLPLHIIFVYPAFIYTASVAVAHMNLRWWAEPFAVGLSVVLIDVPFDIVGIKQLFWTWHDDDPNIYDRHYWVPWTSYYFHATFASSFVLVFHGVRAIFCSSADRFRSTGFICELLCAIITGLFSMPLGVLQFVPVYHPLHDSFGIHSEVCVLLLISLYMFIVWTADRNPSFSARSGFRLPKDSFEILAALLLHFGFFIYLVLFAKPENVKSIGFHQPIGKCGETVPVQTPFGHMLQKTKYLCLDGYYEDYFDFHCVKKKPAMGKEWYAACGTPYQNHTEYIVVVSAFCAVAVVWFLQLFTSGALPRTTPAERRGKTLKRE